MQGAGADLVEASLESRARNLEIRSAFSRAFGGGLNLGDSIECRLKIVGHHQWCVGRIVKSKGCRDGSVAPDERISGLRIDLGREFFDRVLEGNFNSILPNEFAFDGFLFAESRCIDPIEIRGVESAKTKLARKNREDRIRGAFPKKNNHRLSAPPVFGGSPVAPVINRLIIETTYAKMRSRLSELGNRTVSY